MQPGLGNPSNAELRPNHKKDDELLKSIREIGNLSLNRINLLGMLQRAFNSRQKKPSPLPALSLSKSSALALRERESDRGRGGDWKLTYCSPFICMKLFTTFSCCSLFFPIPVPYCSIFLAFWFCPVSAHFNRNRWWWLKHAVMTVSSNWCVLYVCMV